MKVALSTGEQRRIPLRFQLPEGLAPREYKISVSVRFSTGETQEDSFTVHILRRPSVTRPPSKLALFDPVGETAELLDRMGVRYTRIDSSTDLSAYEALIVGKHALTPSSPAPDLKPVRDGLKVLVFEQAPEALEKRLGFRIAVYGLRGVFKRVPDHPALEGLGEEHLRNWRGESTVVPPCLEYKLSPKFNYAPTVRWCGIEVTRLWRCGNRGNVATVLIEKPHRGDFLPILDGGYSLQYSPLLEYREGKGLVLFCQMDVTGRTEPEPSAEILVRNLINYLSRQKAKAGRKALYAGNSAGRKHLEYAGISLSPYDGNSLRPGEVLIVAQGGGEQLSRQRAHISDWLKRGGYLLALALDEREANAFLPRKVSFEKREHIATYFDAFGVGSLFAGVSPAEVHNPAPRKLPLISGGAVAVGDGVLAKMKEANVVFRQLLPWQITSSGGRVPSLSVTTEDAVEGKKSALLTMGTVRWGQFGQKIQAGQLGKSYTFAVFVKPIEETVRLRLEVERAGRPWDRAIRGKDIVVPPDKWTELYVSFTVKKSYPQGWSAYIHCGQEGARLLADELRLYEGEYLSWKGGGADKRANLFKNPSFEEGIRPWWFSYRCAQHNLKRAYRRTSFLLARLLANMGVAGSNPLLERFSTPLGKQAGESVLKNGDFSVDVNNDGIPDGWLFFAKAGTSRREKLPEGGWALALTAPPVEGKAQSALLAQVGIPIQRGQWYRISFRARAENFTARSVTVTVTNTKVWRSLFPYQYFRPEPEWKRFSFGVQSNDTVEESTRFQIWYRGSGKLWLADVRLEPIPDPAKGRWLKGLYLDTPEEWDDPYRFFRW